MDYKIFTLLLLVVASCDRRGPAQRSYARELVLAGPITIRPDKPWQHSTSGEMPRCFTGKYTYSWTDPQCGQVLLCCMPPSQILSGSIQCAGLALPRLPCTPQYYKLDSCSLQHPTSSETTYVRVCIPAPLSAGH